MLIYKIRRKSDNLYYKKNYDHWVEDPEKATPYNKINHVNSALTFHLRYDYSRMDKNKPKREDFEIVEYELVEKRIISPNPTPTRKSIYD